MITLTWWAFVGALALAALAGGLLIGLLISWADDPQRTPLVDDGAWDDGED